MSLLPKYSLQVSAVLRGPTAFEARSRTSCALCREPQPPLGVATVLIPTTGISGKSLLGAPSNAAKLQGAVPSCSRTPQPFPIPGVNGP